MGPSKVVHFFHSFPYYICSNRAESSMPIYHDYEYPNTSNKPFKTISSFYPNVSSYCICSGRAWELQAPISAIWVPKYMIWMRLSKLVHFFLGVSYYIGSDIACKLQDNTPEIRAPKHSIWMSPSSSFLLWFLLLHLLKYRACEFQVHMLLIWVHKYLI